MEKSDITKLIDTLNNTAYDPLVTEDLIYNFWLKNNLFRPESNALHKGKKNKVFSIPLPPPNANGELHLGNASGNIIQDLTGRYHRLLGEKVLLIPGKDHAGIQTEVIFEKKLQKEGIRKRDLGREEFYKQALEFTKKNAKYMRTQEQKTGLSADWDREKFTLDPDLTQVVNETFKQLYDDGYIYRAKRIINWCVNDQTGLADIDTEYHEEKGKLYYIKYGPLVVATTRPETKLADTALAVNPEDKRYQQYIGQEIEISSVEGKYKLPVIGDKAVDPDFGTGVLKITPGHSKEDFEIAQRHNLQIKSIINFYGKMTDNAGKYAGMKVLEAREAIVKDLKELELIEKIEDYTHNIQTCERCGSQIEHLISNQWWIKMKDLAAKALTALEKEGIPKIYPSRQSKIYKQWLENIQDWNISRQLWWGHRIPAYYCGGKEEVVDADGNLTEIIGKKYEGCGSIIISPTPITTCPYCGRHNLEQDTDIFDTWFSSTQWPFTILEGVNAKDFEEFYPYSLMETGRDILFVWVARMVIMGIYKTKKVPFNNVYLHGIVLDKEGKKQSKSKGNGINPLDAIKSFGADALRMSVIVGIAPDQDYRLYDEKIKGYRNFINKVWNASRFIILNSKNLPEGDRKDIISLQESTNNKNLDILKAKVEEITKLLNTYKLGRAGEEIYNFFWHTFCDIWIEESKRNLTKEELAYLIKALKDLLIILHPFAPFITEVVWQVLKEEKLIQDNTLSIMYSSWPTIL